MLIANRRSKPQNLNQQSAINNFPSQHKEEAHMRYVLILLAALGIVVSALALREHYRTEGDSPCSINERWDCGIVNHSPYAMLAGIPVAALGIAGYLLMGALAFRRAYRLLLAAALAGLAFSLYLAHIEKDILGVWCIYCAISLGVISLITLLSLGAVVAHRKSA
jgi:vitamin-K-epoxide reductase (warfarin-sensitive)